jgi:thioesterase domain-containing protein
MIREMGLSMTEALIPIWERVFERSPIGIEDDFFDLGGNSALATKLFAEITRECGRTLPAATICQTPTIQTMAALWQRSTVLPTPPLVLLKRGSEAPPVFVTHGIGGNAIDFVPLARSIQSTQPIYGLQGKGNESGEEPFERIEDMAQYCLDAIKRLQSSGPYFLVGYSLGGLVVLEMAQRLSKRGERVVLVMIDSYPHFRHLSPGQRLRLFAKKVVLRATASRKLPLRETFSGLFPQRVRNLRRSASPSANSDSQRNVAAANRAWASYRPALYEGKVDFIAAQSPTRFPDSTSVWKELTPHMEFETVPGDHLGIVTIHRDRLASTLSHLLKEALSKQHGSADPMLPARREA